MKKSEKYISEILVEIIECIHPDRKRGWHLYPTKMRDEAIRVLKDHGIPVKDYMKCREETTRCL